MNGGQNILGVPGAQGAEMDTQIAAAGATAVASNSCLSVREVVRDQLKLVDQTLGLLRATLSSFSPEHFRSNEPPTEIEPVQPPPTLVSELGELQGLLIETEKAATDLCNLVGGQWWRE